MSNEPLSAFHKELFDRSETSSRLHALVHDMLQGEVCHALRRQTTFVLLLVCGIRQIFPAA